MNRLFFSDLPYLKSCESFSLLSLHLNVTESSLQNEQKFNAGVSSYSFYWAKTYMTDSRTDLFFDSLYPVSSAAT